MPVKDKARILLGETGHGPLREALGGSSTGLKREITIARAGWGSSGYYSEDVLRRDGPRVFPVGTKMYIDHPSLSEESDRPERSIQHMAAVITRTPRMAGIDLVAECELVEHWAPVINNLADRNMLDLSLRAYGLEENGAAGGREGPIITQLLEGISVDFVTEGGLGGKVGKLIEEAVKATPVQEKLASAIREGLASAGKDRWGGRDTYVYLEDYDHENAFAIYCISPEGSETYYLKIAYKEEEGECVLVGDPEEVERSVQYVPEGTGGGGQETYTESMPAHLKEARNVGHWLEASLHRGFTETADNHFGQGYLTREERMGLSTALGDALTAFNASVEENVPQLLERDIYERPENPGTTVSETDRSGGSNQGGPGMGNEDGLSELREEIRRNKEDTDKRLSEAETRAKEAETRADRAEDKLQMIEAGKVIDRVVGDVEGLPDRAQQRVIESVLNRGIPTTSSGAMDTTVLEERARGEIRAEQEYLAGTGSSEGRVSTFGESSRNGGSEDASSNLEQVLRRRGLSESGAKVAAEGRRD